jgi:hypothetical protein
MMASTNETAAPLASALVRARRAGRGRRIALSSGTAPGSVSRLMDRRVFLTNCDGGLLAALLAAGAQQAGKLWRVGMLA